ncbi:hypothetical protein D4Z93_02230 [Clostridium fermenticellae]|uniref:Uncharacterized protein n=1 Tax=Clostridium fermenticellae TaxID=2068654 RepID=A0A386H180_9CLOT|nr:hypothetical protein D4Z93_02230 [Clostridium fermenticellae]
MENSHYLGNNLLPPSSIRRLSTALQRNVSDVLDKLGRLNHKKAMKQATVPTRFHLVEAVQHYEDPRLAGRIPIQSH